MSGNELGVVCDEDKMIAYIYEDVDDSDIFATEPLLNNSFADSEAKSDSEPVIAQNPEITQQHEELKILVEKLQTEKDTLLLRISELLKTAKAEFERKNNRIKDLEKEKDNILFRRGNIFRSKPPDADTRVPVLQQVENDLTNEEFQNFNTRYRIPKKKCDNNDINQTGTIIDEQLKKLKEDEHLENKNTHKENYKNEKYWSAYPKDKASRCDISKSTERNNRENAEKNRSIDDSCSGKIILPQDTDDTDKNRQYRDRGSNIDKHPNDRSRPREKLFPRKSIKKESKTIRSPNNEHRSSIDEYTQKNVQKRSKSFCRYRVISPENYVKQPRSPSREKSQEQHKLYQLKTIDGEEPEHIFKFSENNSIIKKSIASRSKSESRFKPRSPEYKIRQPRTPSRESSESSSRNRDTKSRKSRARSRINYRETSRENERIHSSTGTNKSGSKDEDIKPRHNKEHSRQVNRIRSRDRNTTYSRRDSRSHSEEREDICERDRLNSRAKSYKDGLDHKLGSSNRNNDYRNKSEDIDVRSSRSNKGKIERGENCDKSSQSQDKRLHQSSLRDKADSRKYSERLYSKGGGSTNIMPHFDLREKCRRRSKSYARDRDSRRRGVMQDNSRSVRNERRDRSRSSSVEIAGNERFSHNGENLVDMDRHGNVANYKYRNRSRSSSKERPLNYNIQEIQNCAYNIKSRQRNIGSLKEKLLRHSVDRDRALREDKQPDKNIDIKGVHLNNVDCSDLDDLQLHLSGDSDIDTFNMQNTMEHRDEHSRDTDFELLKDLPMDYENMTDDQIERLVQEREDVYNKVSSDAHRKHISDQDENRNAKFRDCKIKLPHNEDDNGGQIQRINKIIFPLIDVEELDYEPNQCRLGQSVKHCQEEKLEHIKSKQSKSLMNFRNVQQHKTLSEETMKMHEKIIDVQQSTNSAECHSKNNITIYGARQQQKKRDENHQKGTKSLQIHRTDTQLPRSEDANSRQEINSFGFKKSPKKHRSNMCDAERKYQRHLVEKNREYCVSENKDSMQETNKERHGYRQGINKERTKDSYNNLFKNIEQVKQDCTLTRHEISQTRSKVIKAVLIKKHISEDAIGNLKDEEETSHNENQFKEAKVEEKYVAKKNKEKITLHTYKSRKQSTSEVDMTDVNYGTVSEKNDIATKVGEIKSNILNNNEQNTLLSNRLPEMENGSQENGENKRPIINDGERLVQNDEQTVKIIENEKESFDKAPQQNESNIPVENSLVVDVITDDILNRVVDENQLKRESYKDPNSFLHDFSISDEDDNANNEELDQEEFLPEEGKKITITSQVTVQSPSYTPPYPKNFDNYVVEKWENVPKDVKLEVKKTRDKNSRKSLFKDSQFTNEAEQGVTDVHRNEKQMNHDSGHDSPAIPNAVENIPHVADITSRKTINPRPRDSSECMAAIQQAVVEDTFEHISLSTTSNVITEKLDTEELQKCLEEDIQNPNGEKLDTGDTGTKKEIEGQVRTTKIVKNDEHVDEMQKIEQNCETKKRDKLKNKLIGSHEDTMDKLFGPMTPSPCKAMREISEANVNKNKVKRNIAKCEQINDNNDLEVRDKIDGTNRKKSDKKVIDKNDRNSKTKGIRNRSKSGDKRTFHIMIIPPEDVKNSKELKQAVEETTKKDFCSNPTYICDSRDKLGKVFDSPNHYIQKKNQELKEKVKRNLNKKMSSNTKSKEKALPESIAINEHHLIEDTFVGEGNGETKKLEETKTIKRLKHQKHKGKRKIIYGEESSEGEEAKNNKSKDKLKCGKKNLVNKNMNESLPLTQSKKNVTQSSSTDDKKTRNPSFKIKIKRPKSVAKKKIRRKKRSLLDTESSDSFEETDTFYQHERAVREKILSSDVANVTNKKQNAEDNERIQDVKVLEDNFLSNSQLGLIENLVETESKKVRSNTKEKNLKLKGTKRKRTVKAENKKGNENYKEEIKVEQTCKRLKSGQDITNKSEEVKESSELIKATETSSKKKIETREKILDTNNINTKIKGAIEDKSELNNTSTTTNECATEPVKTIKRITPKRIDDSSLISEKEQEFKELQAKRELFIENPESININNKRERLSSSGDNCRPEVKRSKTSLTESIITTEEDFIDNGAHTQIKISESKATVELLSTTSTEKYVRNNDSPMTVDNEVAPLGGPHASPLHHFIQTLDTLSRRCEDATTSDSRLVNAATSQLQPPHEDADNDLNDTFSQFNTKDRNLLGSIKHGYSQISIFSLSNKSIPLMGESKSKSDDTGDSNTKSDKTALNFSNCLNIDSKTSTPIKSRETAVKLDNYIWSESAVDKAEVNVVQKNDNPDIYSTGITSSNNLDLQKSVPGDSNPIAALSTCTSLKLMPNTNISDYGTSLGMTSNVSIGSCVSRAHIKFSSTLKRDRRRPISMIVID